MRNFLLLLIAVFAGASLALGQRISGELRLQVTDPTGSGIHAAATIVGQATGVDRTFETDEEGHFTVRGLPLGRYELILRTEGFLSKTELIEIISQLPLQHEV